MNTSAILAFIGSGRRPDISDNCVYKKVMVKCWATEPDVRPTFSKIALLMEGNENSDEGDEVMDSGQSVAL